MGLLGVLVCVCTIGCENVDWNWDTTWWQKPQRVVRPSRPVQKPDTQREQSSETAEEPPSPTAARQPAPPADSRPASADEGPPGRSSSATNKTPDAAPVTRGPAGAIEGTTEAALPFHHLYLTSGVEPKEAQAGEHRLALRQAPARECATVLEMLYVPMGRSGSESECYLIYENLDEFEAAKAVAPLLDEAPIAAAAAVVGPEAAFKAGVAELLWILGQGAQPDAKAVEACERHLVESLQSSQLLPTWRWAAGLLAGRVASEYRYDYGSARNYYQQAAAVTAPDGLESMTARWWTADSLAQEGQTPEARDAYRAIVSTYGEKWGRSHIVRRSKARSEQRPKG